MGLQRFLLLSDVVHWSKIIRRPEPVWPRLSYAKSKIQTGLFGAAKWRTETKQTPSPKTKIHPNTLLSYKSKTHVKPQIQDQHNGFWIFGARIGDWAPPHVLSPRGPSCLLEIGVIFWRSQFSCLPTKTGTHFPAQHGSRRLLAVYAKGHAISERYPHHQNWIKKTTRTTATSNNHDHNHNHNHGHQQQQRQRRLMHELQNVFVVSQVPAERAQILAEVATKMQKHSQASKKCPMTHCHSGQMLFVCLTLSFLSTIKLVVSFHGPRFVSFPRFPTSTQARITIHHIEIKERLSHCSPIIQLVT